MKLGSAWLRGRRRLLLVALPVGVALITAAGAVDAGAQVTPAVDIHTVAAVFIPVSPVRLLDTRSGNGLSGPFASKVHRTFQVTGRAGVPSEAVAVIGNLTVTAQTTAGYVAVGPIATNNPTTSSLNFPLGDDRANQVSSELGVGGTLSATFVGKASTARTALIFDLDGYFVPDTTDPVFSGTFNGPVGDSGGAQIGFSSSGGDSAGCGYDGTTTAAAFWVNGAIKVLAGTPCAVTYPVGADARLLVQGTVPLGGTVVVTCPDASTQDTPVYTPDGDRTDWTVHCEYLSVATSEAISVVTAGP